MATDVDHIVLGAGLSGLLLTRALLTDADRHRAGARVLLVDPRPAQGRRLTYAYWSRRPTSLDRWAVGSWDVLRVVARDGQTADLALGDWRYSAIDWGRGRAELLDEVAADPRVRLVAEPADRLRDGPDSVSVRAGGRWISGRWLYDSRPPSLSALPRRRARCSSQSLVQVFRGLWITSARGSIDASAATLLDFSADHGDDLAFTYVLPTSATSAMVMAVRMGLQPDEPDPAPAVRRLVAGEPWTAVAEESGATPLLMPPPPRRLGRRVLAIGQRGGRVRPSTGYAVRRILADTDAIRRSLIQHGHPFALPADPRWQRPLDAIWLRALSHEGADLQAAFASLVTRAPIDTVLRFLDGDASTRDLATVIGSLPPRPFIRALLPLRMGDGVGRRRS